MRAVPKRLPVTCSPLFQDRPDVEKFVLRLWNFGNKKDTRRQDGSNIRG